MLYQLPEVHQIMLLSCHGSKEGLVGEGKHIIMKDYGGHRLMMKIILFHIGMKTLNVILSDMYCSLLFRVSEIKLSLLILYPIFVISI